MTREELKQAGTKKLISALQYCGRDPYYATYYDEVVDEITQRLNHIEELEKALSVCNASNSFNKEQLTKAKEIIKELIEDLDIIDGEQTKELRAVKEAEQFLKEK